MTNDTLFNRDFCEHLEFALCKPLSESISGYWCDGVCATPHNPAQITLKSVNDTRRITTTAYIGKDGQTAFEMTIAFGRKALKRYANSQSLIECIPSSDAHKWIELDIERKSLIVHLL